MISLIGLLGLTVLIWYFDLFGNLRDNLVVYLMYAVVPVLIYKTASHERSWHRNPNLYITVSLLLAILVKIGDNLNWPWLTFNTAMIFFALPCLFILVGIFMRRPFLGLGIVPAAVLAVSSLLVLFVPSEYRIDFLFLPIPIVLPLCIVRALIAWKLLDLARANRYRTVWGPLYEFFTMAILFVPFIALVLVVTRVMSENPIWLAVSATILGVLFSNILAMPLRQFLLDLAKLTSNTR